MNETEKELVSISAAVAGKCRPCFAYHYKRAQELGIDDNVIRDVVQLAQDIRGSGDKQIDTFADGKLNATTIQETGQ